MLFITDRCTAPHSAHEIPPICVPCSTLPSFAFSNKSSPSIKDQMHIFGSVRFSMITCSSSKQAHGTFLNTVNILNSGKRYDTYFYTSLTSDLKPTKSNPLNLLVLTWLFASILQQAFFQISKQYIKNEIYINLKKRFLSLHHQDPYQVTIIKF